MLELEKTYLLKSLPKELKNITPVRITDIYIPESTAHAHLRLRQKGATYEITKKTLVNPDDASTQTEETIALTEEEFSALATCSSRKVVKDRYKIPVGKYLAEIDIFQEKLSGLVLADFEFKTEAEKSAFTPPDFALADVTQEEFIAGGFLSGKTYANLTPSLAQFNYKKICL